MAELYGAAADFLREKYGGELSYDSGTAQVGTTAERLLGGDADRLFVLVVNLSANVVYVHFEDNVGNSNGIRLGPAGGSMQIDIEGDAMLTTLPIWAVADGASSNVYFVTVKRFYRTGQGGEE